MRYGLTLAFAALWLVMGSASANAQDFEKGLAAARAGDFATVVAEWQPLAKDGHAEAQFNLGVVYEAGLGVPENPAEAAGWYALAAGQGHAKAQYNLAVMYADGRGVRRDDARAATWMRKAAEQDHGKAQYNLAILYQAGRGLPKDPVQARTWFDRAAANGVAPASAGGSADTSVAETGPRDAPPESADAKSLGPAESASVEPAPLDNGEKPLEPRDAPLAVNSVGLNLTELEQAEPVEPTATAEFEPEPATNPAVASLPAEPLRIAANFPDGARYRIEITETRQRSRDGGFVMAQTSEMGVDMVVKTDPGDGTLIEWTYGPATVETAGDPRAGLLASELGKLIEGQIVAYRTNPSGEVTELGNASQLRSFFEKSIDRVIGGIETQNADPLLIEAIRANLAPLLSEDYAADSALELPRLLHFFSGFEMAPGRTYSRDSIMSLPPSADALPSTLDYELKWFDRAAGVAWLSWRQSADPERAASALKAYIETLAIRSGRTAPEDFDIGAIDVSDSADYEIDLATGFPKQVVYTRKVELFGFSQTEKRRVRVIR